MSGPLDAVIGVWDGHDAGAALVVHGKLVLALNEERLSGRKLEVGFPHRALEVVLRETRGLHHIRWAVTTSDPAKTLTRLLPGAKERYYTLRRRLRPPDFWAPLTQQAKYRLTQWPTGPWWRSFTAGYFARQLKVSRAHVNVVDHHEAHAAAAAYWPEWQDPALIVTLDGIGDGESGSVWRHDPGQGLTRLYGIPGRASLGLFFEHITQALQMRPLEDEGKVMAMASYTAEADPAGNPFLRWFKLETNAQGYPEFHCSMAPSRMAASVERIVWCMPREQVCRYAQQVLEVLIPRLFTQLSEKTGLHDFGYGGGVASNIKVNRILRLLPAVRRLAVCPAMGDGGLAMGAALALWQRLSGRLPEAFTDFKLGPTHRDFTSYAEQAARETGATLAKPEDITQAVAEKVAQGEVVMWAEGRMELGARALGARSIIARADSESARDALNLRLKRRAWYQPFCPSILHAEAAGLLADYRGPQDDNFHMTMGYQVTAAGRKALAGAIGPDGSCRPQMVVADAQDPWYRLLVQVRALTGTGAVINTSLNIHGKPMPDDAAGIVQAWRESGITYLALGECLLTKIGGAASEARA